MNVISNCCLGGHLYRTQSVVYNNPFMWCAVLYSSMKNLILNWDTIDFTKVRCSRSDWVKCIDKNCFKLVVDSKVEVHYTHYIKDVRYTSPKVVDVDVYYADIEKYLLTKYFERLKRMVSPPTFVILDEIPQYDYTYSNVKDLLGLSTNYKIVCITRHKDLLHYNSTNRLCILDDSVRFDRQHCPIFYTRYATDINKFINS